MGFSPGTTEGHTALVLDERMLIGLRWEGSEGVSGRRGNKRCYSTHTGGNSRKTSVYQGVFVNSG